MSMYFSLSVRTSWHVYDLLTNANVSLADEDASVGDDPSKPHLENLSPQPTLYKLRDGQAQHKVKLTFVLPQKPKSSHPSDKGVALKDPMVVILR